MPRSNTTPLRSTKSYSYCTSSGILQFPLNDCSRTGTVTVTKGLEWTPRGYRTFYRVHELHDELKVLRKDHIDIQRKSVVGGACPGRWTNVSPKDDFFEFADADDPDTVIEKVGVGHMPAPFRFFIWHNNRNGSTEVRTFFRLDYIRVFQPRNRYADMEPVYQ